jgi:Flp pilus assembly protein TadB
MPDRIPPQIDMDLEGHFRVPGRRSWPMRIAGIAVVVAVLAGALIVAALALWLVAALIPVLVVAGVVAWAAITWQRWRTARSYDRRQDVFRR